MYFSKLQFDPIVLAKASKASQANKAHNAYAAHQLVWRAFPSAPGTPRDFVFRQEVSAVGAMGNFGRRTLVFYVVSKRCPNVDAFGSAEVKAQVKPYHPQLQSGQRFSISLRANPVVSKCAGRSLASTEEPQRKPGKRHDVIMEAKRLARQQNLAPAEWQEAQRQAVLEWLRRQSEAFGFRVVDEEKSFAINGYRQHMLPRKGQTIQFSSVDITGTIEVREPEQLQKALFQGLWLRLALAAPKRCMTSKAIHFAITPPA